MSKAREKADAKLAAAKAQVDEWRAKEESLAGDLERAESTVGADALTSGDLEGTARRVAELRGQLDVARSTVAAAEAARDAAKGEALRAEAAEVRQEAAELDKQADKHSRRTSELLGELERHEGGRYVPDQPPIGIATDRNPWTPISEGLKIQADGARHRADVLEQQAVSTQPPR